MPIVSTAVDLLAFGTRGNMNTNFLLYGFFIAFIIF